MNYRNNIKSVCIYCASSAAIDAKYFEAADRLASELIRRGIRLICGGGKEGLMGQLTDTVVRLGGEMTGVLPGFMVEIEKQHPGLTEIIEVEDMSRRKMTFLELADALVMLPGGTGTFEEFFEAITLKRLGKILHPIVVLNVDGYFDPLIEMMERAVDERFMDERHGLLWSHVESPEEVLSALRNAPVWKEEYAKYAAVRKK